MTANQYGICAAIVALVVLLGVAHCDRKPEPAPITHTMPTKIPAKQADTKSVAPVEMPVAPTIKPVAKPAKRAAKRRATAPVSVAPVDCGFVTRMAAGLTKVEGLALAKKLGVSDADVAKYRQCVK